MTDANPLRVAAFAELVATGGYIIRDLSYGNFSQWSEAIGIDGIVMTCNRDRSDVDRKVSLGGTLGPRNFKLAELMVHLGKTPTHTDADFVTVAGTLTKDIIAQLAP